MRPPPSLPPHSLTSSSAASLHDFRSDTRLRARCVPPITIYNFLPIPRCVHRLLPGGRAAVLWAGRGGAGRGDRRLLVHSGGPHGCGSGGGHVSAGHPTPESADASDAEREEGEGEAEEASGVGSDPDMSVRRLAAGRQGLFLLCGAFR